MLNNQCNTKNPKKENIYEAAGMKFNFHPGGIELTKQLLQVSNLQNGRILDLGCGLGESLAYFSKMGFETYGIDLSQTVIEQAKATSPETIFFCQSAEDFYFEDISFDAILCECVLSTFQNMDKALEKINKALKPGGLLLWSDLCLKDADDNGRLYTQDEWQAVLKKAYFHSLNISSAETQWRRMISQLLWERDDLSSFCACLPAEIRYSNISYCFGVAQKTT